MFYRNNLITKYFDPARDGLDSSRWETLGGTPTVTGSTITLNQASIIEKSDISRGAVRFKLTIPVAPTAGQSRTFGFKNNVNKTEAVFIVSGTAFTAKVTDEDGNTDSETLTFSDDWVGDDKIFEIRVSPSQARFYIEGVPVAAFGAWNDTAETGGAPRSAMSIYLDNSCDDDLELWGYHLNGAEIYEMSSIPSDITVTTVTDPGTGTSYAHYQNNSFTTTNIKASPGRVYSATITNTTAEDRYFQLFNTATTPTGGATATYKCLVPANGAVVLGQDFFGLNGMEFDVGIAVANSTTAATYTAGSAGDLLVDVMVDGYSGSTGYMLLQTGSAILLQDNGRILLHD